MIKMDEFRSHIQDLFKNPGFQNEAAQIQAKALLTDITEEIPAYRWTYIARRITRNIGMATLELESIATEHPEEIDALSDAARKFALVWEALAKLRESVMRESALLNAAVNYELAGYQANATCIAKQLSDQRLRKTSEEPTLTEMSALFLQRRFLQLLELGKNTQSEPFMKSGLDLSLIESMGRALIGNAFLYALRFFLSGDGPALEKAEDIFKDAEHLFASFNLIEESNLIGGIKSLLPVIRRRATWTLLSDLVPNQPRWNRYLKLLARGVGRDIYRARSVSELWPSQVRALEQGLLTSVSNKIVKMPTSAGKTRIAELAIVHTLVNNLGAKCIYIAPYRALVSELEQSFLHLLGDLGYRVSSISGTYESDNFEELLFRETDILVTTPEKLDLLLRAQPEFLNKVRLFVLDEVQMIQESRRGLKFELLLTRLKRRLLGARFLVLSAVVPQDTLEDFARWFNSTSQDDIVISSWRPSVQRYALFEWSGQTGVIRYAPEEDVRMLREFVPGIIEQQIFEYTNPATRHNKRERFPDASNKAQIAAELAYKFAELGPVLVFCSQANFVKAVAKALEQRLRLAAVSGQDIPSYFAAVKETRSSLLADEWLGDSALTSLLTYGIGVHYGDLPDVIRNAVEADFRERNLRILVATNTLAQGVNLPVKTVIMHSCWRYSEDEDTQVRISARDYWNIAGRAGRAGEETEGLVVHIKVKEKDEEDFKYYLSRRENVEPVISALYQRLIDLIQERLSEEGLEADLDPEVLALLAEEGSTTEDALQSVLEGTLMNVQALRHQRQIGRISSAFTATANHVIKRVPEPELRTVYSCTGLSSTSCQKIREHVVENESIIRDFCLHGDRAHLVEMIKLLLPACLNLSEMDTSRTYNGNYGELLLRWIEGTDMRRLVSEFGNLSSSLEELGKFIDDLFRFRLPWGISGYIRIAKKVLNIENTEMSDFVEFFRSMVKFALPNPISCWAMTIGIPYRRAAIAVAEAFTSEVALPTYEGFLEWLSTLSSDRLRYDFGLTGLILEDVSRAIYISSVNQLLRQFTDLRAFLPREEYVRGIKYGNRSIIASEARVGQQVQLVRDYDNLVDRNAIAVYLFEQEMGYIPREVAQVLAPEMDTGANLGATIVAVEKGNFPRILVRVESQ